MIGLKISRHFLNQQVKPKPIASKHKPKRDLLTSFVIGQSNYFVLGFTTLNWKLLYVSDWLH